MHHLNKAGKCIDIFTQIDSHIKVYSEDFSIKYFYFKLGWSGEVDWLVKGLGTSSQPDDLVSSSGPDMLERQNIHTLFSNLYMPPTLMPTLK